MRASRLQHDEERDGERQRARGGVLPHHGEGVQRRTRLQGDQRWRRLPRPGPLSHRLPRL